jgi:hypothetical protein
MSVYFKRPDNSFEDNTRIMPTVTNNISKISGFWVGKGGRPYNPAHGPEFHQIVWFSWGKYKERVAGLGFVGRGGGMHWVSRCRNRVSFAE